MRTHEPAPERGPAPSPARRAPQPDAPAAPLLGAAAMRAMQSTAGNAAVVQRLAQDQEQESHIHGDGCGHDGEAAAEPTSPVLDVISKPGRGVPAPLQREMANRGQVVPPGAELYTGPQAEAAAASVEADALTVGKKIVVGKGGKNLNTLHHEFKHAEENASGRKSEAVDQNDGTSMTQPHFAEERRASDAAALGDRVPALDPDALKSL